MGAASRTLRHRRRFALVSAPVLTLLAVSCGGGAADPVANNDAPVPVDAPDERSKIDDVVVDDVVVGDVVVDDVAADDVGDVVVDDVVVDDVVVGDVVVDDVEDVVVDDVATATPTTATKRCNLFLHGAGWNNNVSDSYNAEGIHELQPPSPDGAFWLYDGPNDYQQSASTGESDYQRIVEYLRDYVTANGCGPLVVRGSSNGGGLAAKLYCRGEDFGGRAWGYIIEDPVMDVAVEGCTPSPTIARTFFNHSDELRDEAASTASQDFDCEYAGLGWYCEDNTTMTLETYNSHVGTESVRSCATHSGEGCTYTLSGLHMNYVFWEEYDR